MTLLESLVLPEMESSRWLWLFAGLAVKSFVLLAPASLLILAMRRAAPSARHIVWSAALSSLLLLPFLSAALPPWNVALWPGWVPAVNHSEPMLSATIPHTALAPESWPERTDRTVPSPLAGNTPLNPAPLLHPSPDNDLRETAVEIAARPELVLESAAKSSAWPAWMLLIWAAGALIAFVPFAVGIAGVWSIRRRGQMVRDESWIALAMEIRRLLGIKRAVALLNCAGVKTPMTFGFLRPVLLLPDGTAAWPEEWRRIVLLHEMAHVKRADWVAQTFARMACALYWFNPLAWLGLSRMRRECELACDDLVLNSGSKPSAYAEHLLQIAAATERKPLLATAAIAMAHHSNLEGRLLAILDRNRNRRGLSRVTVLLTVIAMAAVLVPAAMVQDGGGARPEPEMPDELVLLPDADERVERNIAILEMNSAGHYRLDGNPARNQSELEAALKAAQRDKPNLTLRIQADPPTAFSELVRAMELCRKLEIPTEIVTKGFPSIPPAAPISPSDFESDRSREIDRVRSESRDEDYAQWTVFLEKVRSLGRDHATLGTELARIHPDPELTTLSQLVTQKERELMLLKQRYTDQHPRIKETTASLERAKEQLDRKIDGILIGIAGRIMDPLQHELRTLERHRLNAQSEFIHSNVLLKNLHAHALDRSELRMAIRTIHPDPTITELSQLVATAERNLASLRLDLTDNHPEVIKAMRVLDKVKEQLDTEIDGVLIGLATRVNIAKERFVALSLEIKKIEAIIDQTGAETQNLLKPPPGAPLKPLDDQGSFPQSQRTNRPAAVDLLEWGGRVVGPDGKAIAGATVVLGSSSWPVVIRDGRVDAQQVRASAQTDAEGWFSIKGRLEAGPPDEFLRNLSRERVLVVAHKDGFGWAAVKRDAAPPVVQLAPWGKIEGTLRIGNAPGRNREIGLLPAEREDTFYQMVRFDYAATTDDNGRFVIERAPPVWVEIGYITEVSEQTFSHTARRALKIVPGEVTRVTLGGEGRPVIGRFAASEALSETIAFDAGDIRFLYTKKPPPGAPEHSNPRLMNDAYWHHPNYRHFAFPIQPDGTFRIDDVPAGTYEFYVEFDAAPSGSGPDRLASYGATVEVPETPGGRGDVPFDLGTLEITATQTISKKP